MELHIRNVSKTYPNGVQALKDVTLTIPAGVYGLLGPNGAGKSTLMRILATLQEADGGSVRLGEIDALNQKDEVRKTLGYLPQEFGVYPKVSAENLLKHFAVLKGITERRVRKGVVEALLRRTNLWDVRKRKLGGFSGGMRQRFGVAVALLGDPKLMIVDEPTAGLDPAERARFLNLLSELGENSVVLLSTHIVEDVSELCTKMAIIDQGTILLEAEPLRAVEDTLGSDHLERYMLIMREQYGTTSTRAAPPLLRATDSFAYSRKGPFALYALREYIGKDRVDEALRRLFEKYSSGAPPLPTSLDLYRELQAVTPNQFQSLLHDLFEKNTFWDLVIDRATAQQTAAGAWQVTLDVRARKVVVDEMGIETEAPMNDLVQVGVFGNAEKSEESRNPLYMQLRRIRSGSQTITVTVPGKPTGAGIDPNNLLVNRDPENNIKNVR